MGYKGTKEEIYEYNRAAQIKYLSDPDKKAAHYARIQARKLVLGKQNRIKVWEWLLQHPCVDCGEDDPVVLEFDHLPGSKKLGNIGSKYRSWSWNKIKEEIEKCEVRCANCHRRKTASRAGWHDFILGGSSDG